MIHPQNTFNQKVKGVEPVSDRLLVKDGFSPRDSGAPRFQLTFVPLPPTRVSGVYSWWE